jgi:hypothetical protein
LIEIYMTKETATFAFQITKQDLETLKKNVHIKSEELIKTLQPHVTDQRWFKTPSAQFELQKGLRSHFGSLAQAILLILLNREKSANGLVVADFEKKYGQQKDRSPFDDKELDFFVRHVVGCFAKRNEAAANEQVRENLLTKATIGILHSSAGLLKHYDQYLQGFVIDVVVSKQQQQEKKEDDDDENNDEKKILRVYVPVADQVFEYPMTWSEVQKMGQFLHLGCEVQVKISFGELKMDPADANTNLAASVVVGDQQKAAEAAEKKEAAEKLPQWIRSTGNENKYRVLNAATRLSREATVSVTLTPPCHRCLEDRFVPEMIGSLHEHLKEFLGENFCRLSHTNVNKNVAPEGLAGAVITARYDADKLNARQHNNNNHKRQNNSNNNNNHNQQRQNNKNGNGQQQQQNRPGSPNNNNQQQRGNNNNNQNRQNRQQQNVLPPPPPRYIQHEQQHIQVGGAPFPAPLPPIPRTYQQQQQYLQQQNQRQQYQQQQQQRQGGQNNYKNQNQNRQQHQHHQQQQNPNWVPKPVYNQVKAWSTEADKAAGVQAANYTPGQQQQQQPVNNHQHHNNNNNNGNQHQYQQRNNNQSRHQNHNNQQPRQQQRNHNNNNSQPAASTQQQQQPQQQAGHFSWSW